MRARNFSIPALGLALGLTFLCASSTIAQQPAAAMKTVGQTGKNIQVLTDLPSDQLIPTMRFFSYSLGVECRFCHVTGDDSKDDKREKKTARNMINMVMAINKDNFGARTAVTCYTCHRGQPGPGPVQIIESTRIGNAAAMTATPPPAPGAAEPAAPALPTVDAIFAKYVEALGGEQALRKITSLTITGTRDTAGRNTQTDVAWAQSTFEQYQKGPNMVAMLAHAPNGSTTGTGFDGAMAWTQNANGVVVDASGTALARAKRAADFYEPLDLKQEYAQVTVRGTAKIGDRDAYLVVATPAGDSAERLYFDTQTGLLLRRVSTEQNILIAAPLQTDYLDYRDFGGVKYPYTIKIYQVSENPQYTVLHVQKVDSKAPVDDSKIAQPASKPQPPR